MPRRVLLPALPTTHTEILRRKEMQTFYIYLHEIEDDYSIVEIFHSSPSLHWVVGLIQLSSFECRQSVHASFHGQARILCQTVYCVWNVCVQLKQERTRFRTELFRLCASDSCLLKSTKINAWVDQFRQWWVGTNARKWPIESNSE